MMTGWIQVNNKYYYLDPETGRMVANTTLTINGTAYAFNVDGTCQNAAGVNAVVANPPGTTGNPGNSTTNSTSYGPGGSSNAPSTNPGSTATSNTGDSLNPGTTGGPGNTQNNASSGTPSGSTGLTPGKTGGPGTNYPQYILTPPRGYLIKATLSHTN